MKKIVFILLMLALNSGLFARDFRFVHEVGQKYRFKNLVHQNVYRNGVLYRNLDMMNKATLEVTALTNGYAFIQGKYYYYEKNLNLNEAFKLNEIYESRFYRDSFGHMIVSPSILMPSLRSIPLFPSNDVKPGDSWTGVGEEIHEGILVRQNILRFNINVNYKYLGDEMIDGTNFAKLSIDYHILHYPNADPDIFSFTGYSHSIYYWNPTTAAPEFYNEDYAFMFTLRSGESVYYEGSTEGKMDFATDITNEQKQNLMAEITNRLPEGGGIGVTEDAEGIIVSLGNILFGFNQAAIKSEFEKKLDALAELLRKYPNIDIVVSGHTDNVGQEAYNQALSENRAKNVADALMRRGVAPTRISYIGYGSRKPIVSNATEEGRQKNRRVEIKLITRE